MNEELEKRWRLILGSEAKEELSMTLSVQETGIDKTLEALYNTSRKAGLGPSSPNVSRWLGDIREYFPNTVVKVMQQDALKRLNLTSMLTEPEMLETVVPDVHLVANLMTLGRAIPEKTKATARLVVKKVVDELLQKLVSPCSKPSQVVSTEVHEIADHGTTKSIGTRRFARISSIIRLNTKRLSRKPASATVASARQ